MLKVDNLVVRYGLATALDQVNLELSRGEIVALVGSNGAGKSTLVNAICGLIPAAAGKISVAGRVAQVPEGRQMFANMTVEDNLRLGGWSIRKRDLSEIYRVLPGLHGLRKQKAGTLSGGQQQMVAIGRALMAEPDLLLIDELSLGLAPTIVADLARHLVELNATQGTTILLIEQEVALAFRISSRAYVLEAGRVVAEGSTSVLRKSEQLRSAYLGEMPTVSERERGPHRTDGAPQ